MAKGKSKPKPRRARSAARSATKARDEGARAEPAFELAQGPDVTRGPGRIGSVRDVAALLGGALQPLGFSPYELYWLQVIGLAVLFWAWQDSSWRRAAWRGWLFGLGAFGVGVSWVQESFQHSNLVGLTALVLAAGFIAFLAVFPALAGALAQRIGFVTSVWRRVLVVPAVWVLFEYLRGEGVSGFAWLQAGYALVDSPLTGLFPLAGVYAASLWTALAAGLVAEAGRLALERNRSSASPVTLLVPAALVLAGAIAGAAVTPERWTQPSGEPFAAALVQGNVAQADKWKAEMRAPTLARYRDLSARHADADLIIWPETAIPGFLHQMRPFIQTMAAQASQAGTAILTGIPVLDAERERFLNSTLLLGKEQGIYHKRHLVPFGEYLPLDTVLRPVVNALGIRVANFSPGAVRQEPLRLQGHEFGVFICYEISFGNEVRAALPQSRFLVTVSNDAWFGRSLGPHQHLQIARARAIETGRWLLRATNTGISVIIDPAGNVVARAPQFEVATIQTAIVPRNGQTPYVAFGNLSALLLTGLVGGLAFLLSRLRRAESSHPQ